MQNLLIYIILKKEGICSCKLDGGDFMLQKGWEDETLIIENTLNNLYLIAARKKLIVNSKIIYWFWKMSFQ